MIELALNATHQLVVLARLVEFCRYRENPLRNERDPWLFSRNKLGQIEQPLSALKAELLESAKKSLLEEMRAGPMTDARFADFKTLFERLLSRGDFADLAINLCTAAGPQAAARVEETCKNLKAVHLFVEERLPAEQRSPSWEKLVKELTERLDLVRLDLVLKRKPRTPKRKACVLRRVRMNTAEYCTVVRIPTTADDHITPFMLPRVEAVVAANLRFLNKYR